MQQRRARAGWDHGRRHGPTGNSGGASATGNVGGSGGGSCEPGTESCPCYPNQTCNSGLECLSDVCVNAGGGGAPSAGGSSSSGATTSTGGSPASGGTATGGIATLTGGMPSGGVPTGGTATGGADTRFVNGPWAGYVWPAVTGTGSSITPTNYDTHAPGTAYCATGSVGPMSDYSGVAIIGYNINQAFDSDTYGTWTPPSTAGGVTVSFTNSGGSELRVQIQGLTGETNENDRWCYPLTGSSGTITIPWTSFNTYCWGGTGTTYYAGQALSQVMLIVPGQNVSYVSFSICLNSIAPA